MSPPFFHTRSRKIFLIHLAVGHPVVVEVAGGREPLAAVLALVGFLVGVDAAVGVQAARSGKSLLTDVALVRPLPGVGSLVTFEEGRPVKRFAAKVARKHLFRLLGCRFFLGLLGDVIVVGLSD